MNQLCPIYTRTGACPNGDKCDKIHKQDVFSRVVCFHHLYPNPDLFLEMLPKGTLSISKEEKQRLADAFYLDVYYMLQRFGPVEDIMIAENKIDFLSGNVYVEFKETDSAYASISVLNGEYYAGRKIVATLTPIQKLSNSLCPMESCMSLETCNFVHELKISENVVRECFLKNAKIFAEPFRTTKRKKLFDTPHDALYGTLSYKT